MEEEYTEISKEDFIKFCETDEYGKKTNEQLCKLIYICQVMEDENHPIHVLASELFEELVKELLNTIEKRGLITRKEKKE